MGMGGSAHEKAHGWLCHVKITLHPTTRIPAPAPPARASQNPSHGNISGTIDLLVSKQPETNF